MLGEDINCTKDFLHDAKDITTQDMNDEWSPQRNYETLFKDTVVVSSTTTGRKGHKTPPASESPAGVASSNLILTVEYKEKCHLPLTDAKMVSDSVNLSASSIESRLNFNYASWGEEKALCNNEILQGDAPFIQTSFQNSVTDTISSVPQTSSADDESDTMHSCLRPSHTTESVGTCNVATHDLTTLTPIKSRSNVSPPSKSILRTPSPAGASPKATTKSPRLVTFADVLHTERTICVSPDNLRRSARRDRSSRLRSLSHPTPVDQLSSPSEKMVRVLVLLMDATSKQYELTSLHFPSYSVDVTPCCGEKRRQLPAVQLGCLLKLIRKATTHKPLKLQRYVGFCRPRDGLEMINSLTVQDNAMEEDEILIAIPKGYTGSECAKLAQPILCDARFVNLVEKLRRRKRMQRRKMETLKEMRKIEMDSVRDGFDGVFYDRWLSYFIVATPVLLFVWTFASIGFQKEYSTHLSNNMMLTKAVNTFFDDIDTGI